MAPKLNYNLLKYKLPIEKVEPPKLSSDSDRAVLRSYLAERWEQLNNSRKSMRNGVVEEPGFDYYLDGCEIEILCAFDELLGEEPPDLRRKPRKKRA